MAELTKSAKAHARLSHPVIDSDGHWIEYLPALTEYIKKVIGNDGADRYWAAVGSYFGEPKLTTAQRREKRLPVSGWWAVPTKNTLDRATVMLPKLLHERMGDLGLDFAVLYPTAPTLTIGPYLEDEEIRRGRLPRAQHVRRRSLRRLSGPFRGGRRHPEPYSQRGDRGA